MARSDRPNVVSRSETAPSLKVSSLTATPASVRPRAERHLQAVSVPWRVRLRGVEIALEVGRMPELAELRRAPTEEEADRPVRHQPRPAAYTRHEQVSVGLDPSMGADREPEVARDRRRLDPGGPAQRPRGDPLAARELDGVVRNRVHARVRAYLDPSLSQLARGESGERRRDLGH